MANCTNVIKSLEKTSNSKHRTNRKYRNIPPNIHLFKASNRNTRKRCEIYSKLTIKTLERRQH